MISDREQSAAFPTTSKIVQTNGVRLHVIETGPEDGELVIVLHGFPEFWYGWRFQIGPLANAGYRVWAPDQRGYNLSDKPPGLNAYRLDVLAADIIGLLDAAGRERATIVGHDWGGVVAWWLGLKHANRVAKLGILNSPHPGVFRHVLTTDVKQMFMSAYIAFFNLPVLPEFLMLTDDCALGLRGLVASSQPGTFRQVDLARYREAWTRPGAMTGMLNWYRSVTRMPPPDLTERRVRVPTLIIWGTRDQFLSEQLAPRSAALCDDGRLELVPAATHWVQHEEAERVNRLLLAFLAE